MREWNIGVIKLQPYFVHNLFLKDARKTLRGNDLANYVLDRIIPFSYMMETGRDVSMRQRKRIISDNK